MEKIINKKWLPLTVMFLILITGVIAITAVQFVNLDLDNVNRNIQKIGISKYTDISNETQFSYKVSFDTIVEVNGTYPIITADCNYDIDKNKYKRCVYEYNKTFCLSTLKNNIREYCIHKLDGDMERMKRLQEEAIQSMDDSEIEFDLNTLDVNI